MTNELFDKLQEKIQILDKTAWSDKRPIWPQVEIWLDQFDDDEKIQFLYLLSNFMYFGLREIRECLKALYRDLYKYPVVAEIRKKRSDTKDRNVINGEFIDHLQKTVFIGMGNPSESGTHLLYFFRQVNGLSKKQFKHGHEIYSRDSSNQTVLRTNEVKHYVFIDDLCGSGTQAKLYSQDLIATIKALNPDARISYLVLFATTNGLAEVQNLTNIDDVGCVFELGQTFKCFEPNSRYYKNPPDVINRAKAREICTKYDAQIRPGYELGYKSGQLLLSFYHNTPDNVPPVFWYNGEYKKITPKIWRSIFERFDKIY